MRKLLLIFIILSGILANSDLYSFQLDSKYQSYYGNISFLNNYHYSYPFSDNLHFRHYGTLTQSRNRRFHRYTRNADLIWQVSKSYESLLYSLHLDYNAAIDKAKPDQESYVIEKNWRRVGLDLSYNPYDSLFVNTGVTYIRAGEVNSRISDGTLHSNGYHTSNNIRYARDIDSANLLLYTFLEVMHLDYDFTRNYGANLNFAIMDPNIETELSFRRYRNKIYLLNDQIDTHIRSDYWVSATYRETITENLSFSLGNTFQVRDNRLRARNDRNYLEIDYSLASDIEYRWRRFRLFTDAEHRIVSRSFKEELNTRYQEFRQFRSGVSYYYSDRDSLVFTRNLNLIRTDYTISTNVLDNDQLYDEKQVSIYTHLRDEIRLINHFNFTQREEVYLQSGMSANNKTTSTYNLLPSLNIALNRNLLFIQDYHLRADYDDFKWGESIRDRMYRKFSASYSVLTNFPWFTGRDYILPDREYFYYYNNLVLGLTYIYDTNSSGNSVGNAYEVFAENEYHTLQMELFRRIDHIEFRIRPRFTWVNVRYEFNHQFDLTYLLPDRKNFISVGINGSGNSLDELLWRVNALVHFAL